MWAAVHPRWKVGSEVNRVALEEVFPLAGKGRDEAWLTLDKNGNGSVSLAEYDAWAKARTAALEKKQQQPAVSFHRYARPCLLRAFFRANKSSGDDSVVSRDELRCLFHATHAALCLCRALDAHALWEPPGVDRRVSADVAAASLQKLNGVLKDFGACQSLGDLKADTLEDALDTALALLPNVMEEQEEKPADVGDEGLRVVYGGCEIRLREVTKDQPPSAPLRLEMAGLVITVAPRDPPSSPPSRPTVSARPSRAPQTNMSPCERCGVPRLDNAHSRKPSDPEQDLPHGWAKRWDKHKRRYYYTYSDKHTKTTTWIHPLTGVRPVAPMPFTKSSLT